MTKIGEEPRFCFTGEDDDHGLQEPALSQVAMKKNTYDVQTIASSCVALTAQVIYSLTQLSLFRVLYVSTLTWCVSALSQKVFQDYTFMKEIERFCIFVITQYPLLPLVMLIVATLTVKKIPLIGLSVSIASGALTGFSLRTKWNIAIMQARL